MEHRVCLNKMIVVFMTVIVMSVFFDEVKCIGIKIQSARDDKGGIFCHGWLSYDGRTGQQERLWL